MTVAVDRIDVWFIDLETVRIDPGILDRYEWERAERFHFTGDRERFLARRTRLREILGTYLGEHPAEIAYEIGPKGKPAVEGCSFNLSHSGTYAVLGISQGRDLGVDLEYVLADHDPGLLLPALTPEERSALGDGDLVMEILKIWTRKEALVKAIGVGLAVTPNRLSSFAGTDGVVIDPRVDHDDRWALASLDAPFGYVAAIAAAGARPVAVDIHS